MENLLEVKLGQKWIFDSIRLKVYEVWNTWYLKIIEWDWIGYKNIMQGVDGVTRFNLQNSSYCTKAEFYCNRPLALRGHVTYSFHANESYMSLPSKTISGSYLKHNNSDLVFQTRTIILKWVSSSLVTWSKCDF